MHVDLWVWGAVIAFILSMLAVDLFMHRDGHEIKVREAAGWSAVWIALGLGFGLVVWVWMGGEAAGEYVAGYLIEKSLSIDNIFVFALLFSYFAVPGALQHRVLFWGVLGALVMRAIFIAAGAALLERFWWMALLFGAFLILTGIKMARHREMEVHPERNPVLRVLRRFVPIGTEYHGQRFFVREAGKRIATPLLAVLVAVETTDVIFAVDSIPAIFAVTTDTFLVFTSNAFAILGLRALYFVLAGMMGRFRYLKLGLAAVLVLVGAKMVAAHWFKVPIWISLIAIAVLIGGSIVASLRATAAEDRALIGSDSGT